MILQSIRSALLLLILLTILTGGLYPLVVTGIAQFLFPHQANGSLLQRGEETIGSALIGQSFTDPHYFWGRPSATSPSPYNAASSMGSNLGPLNPELLAKIKERIMVLRTVGSLDPIPIDLVMASASGLDPHISPEAAFYQVPRVAKARGITEAHIHTLVQNAIEGRLWRVVGEPRVNVIRLNLALDALRG